MFLNDEDFEEFSCSVDECKMHSVDLAGNLHEIEGSIHIGEASTPYTNAAYVISLGSEKIYLCDCSIQKLPVRGLYIFQEPRWNRLFRIELVGLDELQIDNFEEILEKFAMSFQKLASRIHKDHSLSSLSLSPSESTKSSRVFKMGETFSRLRKRCRPALSDAFSNLRKRSKGISQSTENLARLSLSPFRRKKGNPIVRNVAEIPAQNMCRSEILDEIEKLEIESEALREMHDLYRNNPRESVPQTLISSRAQNAKRLAELRSRLSDLDHICKRSSTGTILNSSVDSSINQSVSDPDGLLVSDLPNSPILLAKSFDPMPRTCQGNNTAQPSDISGTSESARNCEKLGTAPRKPGRTRSMRSLQRKMTKINIQVAQTVSESDLRLEELHSELIEVLNIFDEPSAINFQA